MPLMLSMREKRLVRQQRQLFDRHGRLSFGPLGVGKDQRTVCRAFVDGPDRVG